MRGKNFVLTASLSTTYDGFVQPALQLLADCSKTRVCPAMSDADWVSMGIQRVVQACSSGRAFLQTHGARLKSCPEISLYFHSLKSERRLKVLTEVNGRLLSQLAKFLPDELGEYPQLANFDVYAGDGHWHEAAAHDPRIQHKTHATGHFYALNLRNRTLHHLTLGKGKKEHDIHALKRLSPKELRQGAPDGRQVIYVWDKACYDFRFWHNVKQSAGVYFITLEKEKNALQTMGVRSWDKTASLNQGVLTDQLVGSSNGVMLRRISCIAPDTGVQRVFLTTEMTLPPGIITHLYHRRWRIEKIFDSLKNKLNETKAWATGSVAKTAQAHFLCLTHNLLRRLEQVLAAREKITNLPDEDRQAARLEQQKQLALNAGRLWPSTWNAFSKPVQYSVKLIRWLRSSITLKLPWHAALPRLRALYSKL